MFRVPKESTPFYRFRPISRCFITWTQIQIHLLMEDFILIIIMLQQSDKGFGSGKKHVLDICTKSYANGLGAI